MCNCTRFICVTSEGDEGDVALPRTTATACKLHAWNVTYLCYEDMYMLQLIEDVTVLYMQ